MKVIDLNSSVFDLIKENPELKSILSDLGFTEITNSIMLNSVGKMMNLKKGSIIKDIPMETIISTLKANGFQPVEEISVSETTDHPENKDLRHEQLKEYLVRLGQGEDLEAVRKDFAENFSGVESSEIMAAEQELLLDGIPLAEVQRLCDVHSALFHNDQENLLDVSRQSEANQLAMIEGHPLNTFSKENLALSSLLNKAEALLKLDKPVGDILLQIKDVIVHYKKKGDLLYPVLKVKYNVTGPHQVMWTVDDEIRDELNKLIRLKNPDDLEKERIKALIERMKEMIYKEENILFPISAKNLSEEDWIDIYRDSKDYDSLFSIAPAEWFKGEKTDQTGSSWSDQMINMPGGHLSIEQLECMLNTLPIEITFVDVDDVNCYFNEGHKVFKRPLAALGRKVFDCHPPKVEKVVRGIIDDLRNHRRQNVAVWMQKEGKPFLVNYRAVLDRKSEYLGTVEIVQDMSFAKEYFEKLFKADQYKKQQKWERELEENPSVQEVKIHHVK